MKENYKITKLNSQSCHYLAKILLQIGFARDTSANAFSNDKCKFKLRI
ncbi:hypothetical protein [Helicobacter sp. MIT 14-3879]|nr:hypothetical protein [Helicobacter sp. MIT 14-3879]